MKPDFTNIIAQYHAAYITANSAPPPNTNMFVGNQAPISPDVFLERLQDEAKSYPPNDWPLPAQVGDLIEAEHVIYVAWYEACLRAPLESGANAEVANWYNSERIRLGIS